MDFSFCLDASHLTFEDADADVVFSIFIPSRTLMMYHNCYDSERAID